MIKRTDDRGKHVEARLMTAAAVAEYLSLGINNAVAVATKAGARRQFGKRVVYDKKAIDAYVDAMAAEAGNDLTP